MMGRRVFLGTLGLLPVPLAAEAQPVGKVHRLGILGEKASDLAEARPWQGLREELGSEAGSEARTLVADLARLRVDATRTCRRGTRPRRSSGSLPRISQRDSQHPADRLE